MLPATIIIASLILGGFFYASQVNKQRSIERQQEIKLEESKRQQEAKLQEDRRIEKAKAEQEHKEYVAKRKKECYDYEISEKKKFGNVVGSFYDEKKDVCKVRYKNNEYNEAVCEKKLKLKGYKDTTLDRFLIPECNKYFTNEF